MKTSEKTGKVVGALTVQRSRRTDAHHEQGPDGPHPREGDPRGRPQHQGVKLMDLKGAEKLQAIAPVVSQEASESRSESRSRRQPASDKRKGTRAPRVPFLKRSLTGAASSACRSRASSSSRGVPERGARRDGRLRGSSCWSVVVSGVEHEVRIAAKAKAGRTIRSFFIFDWMVSSHIEETPLVSRIGAEVFLRQAIGTSRPSWLEA